MIYIKHSNGLKTCTNCHETKSVDSFHRNYKTPDGLTYKCKECQAEYDRGRRGDAGKRNAYLKRKYGISNTAYNKMFEEQNGCCAICGRHQQEFTRKFHIDHDHETGMIRELLCSNCNSFLGLALDSVKNLESALAYLRKWKP